jgi:hypothetical protein
MKELNHETLIDQEGLDYSKIFHNQKLPFLFYNNVTGPPVIFNITLEQFLINLNSIMHASIIAYGSRDIGFRMLEENFDGYGKIFELLITKLD